MDIRIINKKDEIINVTNLSIMSMEKWLVGMNDKGEIVRIEEYESKEEAKEKIKEIGLAIKEAHEREAKNLLIRTQENESSEVIYGSDSVDSTFR